MTRHHHHRAPRGTGHHHDSFMQWFGQLWPWFRDHAWPPVRHVGHYLLHQFQALWAYSIPIALIVGALLLFGFGRKTFQILIGVGLVVLAAYLAWSGQTHHSVFPN